MRARASAHTAQSRCFELTTTFRGFFHCVFSVRAGTDGGASPDPSPPIERPRAAGRARPPARGARPSAHATRLPRCLRLPHRSRKRGGDVSGARPLPCGSSHPKPRGALRAQNTRGPPLVSRGGGGAGEGSVVQFMQRLTRAQSRAASAVSPGLVDHCLRALACSRAANRYGATSHRFRVACSAQMLHSAMFAAHIQKPFLIACFRCAPGRTGGHLPTRLPLIERPRAGARARGAASAHHAMRCPPLELSSSGEEEARRRRSRGAHLPVGPPLLAGLEPTGAFSRAHAPAALRARPRCSAAAEEGGARGKGRSCSSCTD